MPIVDSESGESFTARSTYEAPHLNTRYTDSGLSFVCDGVCPGCGWDAPWGYSWDEYQKGHHAPHIFCKNPNCPGRELLHA